MSSAICFNLDQSKILSSGNEFENIVENGKHAGHQHFLLFPQFFRSYEKLLGYMKHLVCYSFHFGPVKFLSFGIAFNPLQTTFFYFHVNDRKFSKGVENAVGKGEIALYEQFLLFPQCFQKTCTADT